MGSTNLFEQAFKIKAKLMAFEGNIPAPIETYFSFKPYIKALKDHDIERTNFHILKKFLHTLIQSKK